MVHKKTLQHPRSGGTQKPKTVEDPGYRDFEIQKLEIVVKCDVSGTVEAVTASIADIDVPSVQIDIIQSGVGNISKSDAMMALTGSKLIIGFNVDVMSKSQEYIMEQGIEVRLYDVIYNLTQDIRQIAQSLIAREPEEEITGRAKVIATFKGGSKAVIIGCEVLEGKIEVGRKFRVITVMGPAYVGKIESLQVERKPVKEAKTGQQVGLKLTNWKKTKIGDLVECYKTVSSTDVMPWKPKPGILHFKSA